MSDKYTLVTEQIVRGLCNHRLRFGNANNIVERENGITVHGFKALSTFGMIRWQRNDYGTILWNLYICETKEDGRVTEIPGVYPAQNFCLDREGRRRRVVSLPVLPS